MDYSKFLDEDFDVKEWVNVAFRAQKDNANKDQYATTLVMKLQMFIQEVNNVIEETSQQAIQNLPRVMREIEAVKQESLLLQEQMRLIKQDIQKVEHDTASSMQMLLQIDAIKSRLQAASSALKEADNWTTLSADVEDVFQSQDIDSIAGKLVGMQQSLKLLVDVPDYEDRCRHLEALKNRLEAMLSPQLVSAFNSHSVDTAKGYVKIFSDINRLPQLYKYYHKCHKSQLMQSWRTILDTQSNDSLMEWLPQLYDLLLSTWHSQVKWCSQIFSDPVAVVCDLLTETLCDLDPSVQSCIAAAIDERSDSLMTLIDLKQVSERFANNMEGAIESSTSGDWSIPNIKALAAAIYMPYQAYMSEFAKFEEDLLMSELNNIPLDHPDVIDSVRLLGESVTRLFSAANASNDRCLSLSSGCCYVGLLQALQVYFSSYVSEFRRVLVNLREKCMASRGQHREDDDWSQFQHSLRIIQTCGELIMHVEELDQTLVTSILTSVGKFSLPTSPMSIKDLDKRSVAKKNPFHNYSSLLLGNQTDQVALESLISKLEEGDVPTVLPDVVSQVNTLSEEVHTFAFDIAFRPLKEQLSNVALMEVWQCEMSSGAITSDLPTFSLSPLEYITKAGQYLLTLPQHLEPFILQDNPAVIVALKHGKLPYTSEQEVPDHIADLWLQSIARGTMHVYAEEVLKIKELTAHATKQLVTDIDYLCNVLEDLGLQESDALRNIETLLRAKPEEYTDVAEQLPQRLVGAISQMRNLKL